MIYSCGMIETILKIGEIVLSALLIGAVLIQARGTGLGEAFGGSGNVYQTKRGVEKVVFRGTIVIAVLFFGVAIVDLVR